MDDFEKFEFYCNAKFYVKHGLIFNSIVVEPTFAELTCLLKTNSEHDIEKLYNHVDLSAITEDYSKQFDFCYKIFLNWRKAINRDLPDIKCRIVLIDNGNEIAIYASRI